MDKKLLHKFWSTAAVEGSSIIVFSYKRTQYRFTSNDVADAISLPRDTAIDIYDREVLARQVTAIGLQGEHKATIKKSFLPPRWRMIAEVLLRCFRQKLEAGTRSTKRINRCSWLRSADGSLITQDMCSQH